MGDRRCECGLSGGKNSVTVCSLNKPLRESYQEEERIVEAQVKLGGWSWLRQTAADGTLHPGRHVVTMPENSGLGSGGTMCVHFAFLLAVILERGHISKAPAADMFPVL